MKQEPRGDQDLQDTRRTGERLEPTDRERDQRQGGTLKAFSVSLAVILTIYLNGSQQMLTEAPVTPATRVMDVVEYCKEAGEGECHLAEVWSGHERVLPHDLLLLDLLQQWGSRRSEVSFYLRHCPSWSQDVALNPTTPVTDVALNPTTPVTDVALNPTTPVTDVALNPTTPVTDVALNLTPPVTRVALNPTTPVTDVALNLTPPVTRVALNLTPPVTRVALNPTTPVTDVALNLTPPVTGVALNLTPPVTRVALNLTPPVTGVALNPTTPVTRVALNPTLI
ncbi:hypothetical protein NHX12_019313 [Muraenolepis orangiensis]|uniref:Apoptosis-stimulating of p53 protein 2-like RA domain-containing protein n=1 Tax=Muraenolepis orangiensis TaxID=630683 RepID=A0A9Q0ESZ3_9TELE|nr:hypothetical protein NHX12_019313 [Muraenolepis orangiensis]